MRYPDSGGQTSAERARRERVRFEAAKMFEQGIRPPEVAERLRISRKSAYAWHRRWASGGTEALRSKGPSGRPSRIRPEWRAWLETELERGPAAHGWTEDQRWTLARISTVLARHFHVSPSVPQMWRILHQMGWTAQIPQHRAAERDDEAATTWVKETLAAREKTVREKDAWLVFADEAGQSLRPPRATTWSPRGITPTVRVNAGSGRISLASAVCCRPGERTRLIYRILVHHPGRRTEKKGFREPELAALLDAAYQQLGRRDIVLVWDNSTQHTDAAMRALIAARSWLTVFRLPPYCPELNPDEGVWSNLKKSLANLAACTLDQLAALAKTRLKRMQYRPGLLDGFIAETGLILTP
ncbi:IS630 family transposase [Streptomyces hirsutus]